MLLSDGSGRHTFKDLLYLVYPTPGPIELITKQLIGRAGRRAKPAVNTGPQDAVSFPATRCFPDEVGEMGFHLQRFVLSTRIQYAVWIECLPDSVMQGCDRLRERMKYTTLPVASPKQRGMPPDPVYR